jgi:hypothetical protein
LNSLAKLYQYVEKIRRNLPPPEKICREVLKERTMVKT